MTTSNTQDRNGFARHAVRSAAMTVAVASAAAVLTACASGTHAAGGVAGASQASLTNFCRDYTWAANAIQSSYGDPRDPNFAQGMQYLLNAKKEAPAGIAGAVNTLFTQLDFAFKNPTKTVDVSTVGEQVTVWAAGHCPAAANSSGAENSSSSAPNSTDTSTDSNGAIAPVDTGSSTTDSSSAPALATALRDQLLNTVNTVDVLASQADAAGGAPPSLSQWQNSEASLNALQASLASANAPQQLQNDVSLLVGDVQDIVANGSVSAAVSVVASNAKNDAAQSSCTTVSN